MGFSLSWVAVRAERTETLLRYAGLKKTGETAFYLDEPITLGHLPTRWDIILFDREDVTGLPDWLGELSKDGELMAGFVEEHVMSSALSFWKDGCMVWDVRHDAQKGILDLQIKGDTPSELVGIRASLMEKQKAEGTERPRTDYIFDIPTELSKALTGFKHDDVMDGFDDEACEVLEGKIPAKESKEKPSLLKRLFGSK